MVVLGLVRLGEAEGPGQETRDLVIEAFLAFGERSEIDPFAVRHDLQAFTPEKDVEPGDVRVRMALAHDEKPRPSVRGELDLEAGASGHGLHARARGPEDQVVDAIAAGEARVGNVLADDFRGVPAVPDEMGEAGEQDSRKDERAEQEALEHVRGEVYVRARSWRRISDRGPDFCPPR